MEPAGNVSESWEENAEDWIAWTRTPDNDVFYRHFQQPAFARLVPRPGRRTVEIGCGEGRVGRWLAGRGHSVAGIDSSPTLVRNARAAGGYDELICGDAARLPWADGSFDTAVAFMALHDMPVMPQAIREMARVLECGSPLCIAIVHPINRPPEQLADYFTEHRISDEVAQNGLRMNFVGINRPFEDYARELCEAGFVIEALHEPRPDPAAVEAAPALAAARRSPLFLHLRCRLVGQR